MYHNQPFMIEVPDDVDKVTRAVIVEKDGRKHLHLEMVLRSDREYSNEATNMRLHLTNGVNHHFLEVDVHEEKATQETKKSSKKKEEE